ncbi:hypothetical protein BJ508DRAFT_324774 [Ascobolus immersus RN42]|uniref:RING-type domain-containing protein n=1 Tax=Ascobolus immersus RN42 TaxID=1160509 RepID=A0A3N4IAR7_ASCIM|nr:hypothetical protein BJ508DRAFT_324774 [Ascobolus immersus RN42]
MGDVLDRLDPLDLRVVLAILQEDSLEASATHSHSDIDRTQQPIHQSQRLQFALDSDNDVKLPLAKQHNREALLRLTEFNETEDDGQQSGSMETEAGCNEGLGEVGTKAAYANEAIQERNIENYNNDSPSLEPQLSMSPNTLFNLYQTPAVADTEVGIRPGDSLARTSPTEAPGLLGGNTDERTGGSVTLVDQIPVAPEILVTQGDVTATAPSDPPEWKAKSKVTARTICGLPRRKRPAHWDSPNQSIFLRGEVHVGKPCMACGDPVEKDCYWSRSVPEPLSCGHHYCRHCQTKIYLNATKDSSAYPPKCCGKPLPSAGSEAYSKCIRMFLDRKVERAYRIRARELEDSSPVYCHVARCGAYIQKGYQRNNVAHCYNVGPDTHRLISSTCIRCGRESHQWECHDDKDPHLGKLLELATEEKWRRCFNCGRMIEKTEAYACAVPTFVTFVVGVTSMGICVARFWE